MSTRKPKQSRTLWSFGKDIESNDNIHKAAQELVGILKAASKPLTRDELISELKTKDLGTKQAPIRVLYHWKKHLKDKGYIVITQQEPVLKKAVETEQPQPAAAAA